MKFTNDELNKMTYDELCKIKPSDMADNPPVRGLGFPHIVQYKCKYCDDVLEGSERTVKKKKLQDVRCPYCNGLLWNSNGDNILRRTAFPIGHFDISRKKLYLKYLKRVAKRKQK